MSAAPVAATAVRVSLADTVELLHTHLTAALCHTVFHRVRNRERQRRWTLAALAQFWTTVILTAPRSLTQVLQEGGMMFPALGPAARTRPRPSSNGRSGCGPSSSRPCTRRSSRS